MEKFNWLTQEARQFLDDNYIQGQTAEERYQDISNRFEQLSGIDGWGAKWAEYFRRGWTTLSSPIISNLGKDTGLPASCNMLDIQDTLESIGSGEYEMMMLASNGAGTARNFSKIRPLGQKYGVNGKSVGIMKWIKGYAEKIQDVSQGGQRRGFLTAGLSVSHPEIMNFLTIGREGSPIKRITTYVTIPENWMQEMIDGDERKFEIFTEIHESRAEKGYPYILFEDNANKGKSEVYKDKWLTNTNICSECLEWTDAEKEFLCVLMSVNLTKWDEFKDTDFIFDCNLALDCVITEYIEKARHIKGHEKAVKFAEEHRSTGLGVMGLATLFQMKSIVYGSLESFQLNHQIFKRIREESDRASKFMAEFWGEPLMTKGTGWRNTSRIAIAPTKSTSHLAGDVSEGINLIESNYNTRDLAKGQSEWKNPQLMEVLEAKGINTEEVWDSILENNGSVSHIKQLTQHEKDVFKISAEVSQLDHVSLAANRVKFIDQSQSLNVTIPATADAFDVMSLTIEAWKKGLKTMYYQHNINMAREATSKLLTCSSCEA